MTKRKILDLRRRKAKHKQARNLATFKKGRSELIELGLLDVRESCFLCAGPAIENQSRYEYAYTGSHIQVGSQDNPPLPQIVEYRVCLACQQLPDWMERANEFIGPIKRGEEQP